MAKIQGSMEVLNSLQVTDKTAGLDKASKELMKNKEILAIILKGVVSEYAEYSYAEIMEFIEADSITGKDEVTVGRNSTRIVGDDKEYALLGEKTSNFDTKFRAVNPQLSEESLVIYLHIDVETQKSYKPGYPVEKRGLYYLARELSAQLSVVTENTDYGQLEKCYSIWICRDDVPQNEKFSISFYEVENTKNYGKCVPNKESYDLLNLVVIRLGDSVYNGVKEDEGYDILRFLHTIMYPHKEDFLSTVKEYIDFSQNELLWEEMDRMSGLGASILEEGIEKGIEQGIEKGIEQGIEQGREEGIQRMIEACQELGASKEATREKLLSKFSLDESKAEEYMNSFWK